MINVSNNDNIVINVSTGKSGIIEWVNITRMDSMMGMDNDSICTGKPALVSISLSRKNCQLVSDIPNKAMGIPAKESTNNSEPGE